MEQSGEKKWVRAQVIADYQNGLSLWKVSMKWRGQATQVEIRKWLEGQVRPRSSQLQGPSEDEVEARRLEVQSWWTPEQASKRWVGRLIQPKVSIHSSASKLLPD